MPLLIGLFSSICFLSEIFIVKSNRYLSQMSQTRSYNRFNGRGYPNYQAHGAYASRRPQYVPATTGHSPPCAVGRLTYCENVNNYPYKDIERLLKQRTASSSFDSSSKIRSTGFSLPSVFTDERQGLQEPPRRYISKRSIGIRKDEKSLITCGCNGSKKNSISIKMAMNINGVWRFTIPRMTRISSKEKITSINLNLTPVELCRHVPNEDHSLVKQRQLYSHVKLMSLSMSRDEILEDTFILPTCCSCH